MIIKIIPTIFVGHQTVILCAMAIYTNGNAEMFNVSGAKQKFVSIG
jgi:hypothetical protein